MGRCKFESVKSLLYRLYIFKVVGIFDQRRCECDIHPLIYPTTDNILTLKLVVQIYTENMQPMHAFYIYSINIIGLQAWILLDYLKMEDNYIRLTVIICNINRLLQYIVTDIYYL